jgi:hypothetical protein
VQNDDGAASRLGGGRKVYRRRMKKTPYHRAYDRMFPRDREEGPLTRQTYGRRVAAVLHSLTKDELYRSFGQSKSSLHPSIDRSMSKATMLARLSRRGWSRL